MLLVSTDLLARQMPPADVEVYEINVRAMAPTIALKGEVASLQDAVLSAEVEGLLEDILLVGAVVKKGQVIAQLNRDRMSWQMQRAEAELASLRADLAFRRSEVERFTVLASQDNASKTQLQRELANTQMLEQQIVLAQVNLNEAQRLLADTAIKAPFDGVLAARHAQVGELIRVGDPLVRLVNTEIKDIVLPTPIQYQSFISVGTPLLVEYRGKTLNLPIRHVVPIGDPNSRMIEVRIDANKTPLLVGDAVTVSVPKAHSSDEPAVPRDALIIRGAQTFVYRVSADQQAEQVLVKVRFADGDWIVVDGPINAGDRIIVRGAERLQPNAKVNVKNP
ncbi:efflux RND transporter periplasmic adaptor subunit [Alteromonas sp. ASW11-36]|uniref:Efflux RND transporter periplasmic adaptor subunit n=1 Tax=Alteromonas arenosi TaxID=3055817 RepID=A0ABT7SWG6_9ALTE|nr:efflux RND transporter periplasmic adaptor subunit [Alteromonas sp. ASW11-36]MDM7860533.1 efflux RND transporter periplasmic adaptor subunit [Alteromonas sp. ASW11-36]